MAAEKKKRRRADPNSDSESEWDPPPRSKPRPSNRGSSSTSGGALSFKKLLKPDSAILDSLQKLYDSHHKSPNPNPPSLSDLSLPFPCREVSDLPPSSVEHAIESTILRAASSILSGAGFSFSVPARAASNQLYVPELDRIVLKDKSSARSFSSLSTVRKAAITARVLSLVHQLCLKNIHVTKRDLFYTDVKLFSDQSQSDAVLDDVSCMLGCTRSSLNVVASEKGVVVGRLVFSDDGDRIDCTKMGVGGKAIPPNIDRVSDLQSDALFILLVEKDAAFMRLAEDRCVDASFDFEYYFYIANSII